MNYTQLKSILSFGLLLLVFLTPLIFTSLTPNYFTTAKQALIVLVVAAFLAAEAVMIYSQKKFVLLRSSLILPLVLFGASLLLSLSLNREGRTESLVGYGLLYFLGLILAIFASKLARIESARKAILLTLTASTTILALATLLQLTIFPQLSLPAIFSSRAFTPTGNTLTTLSLLVIGAVGSYSYASRLARGTLQYVLFACGITTTIAAVALASLMTPGGELAPNLLPLSASWSIALDALKGLPTLLIGVGPANFSSLYTAVKPLSLNATNLWNITPASSSSELLQILSTLGLFGFASFLLLPLTAIFRRPTSKTPLQETIFLVFLTTFLALVVTPISSSLAIIFFITLGILLPSSEHELTLSPAFATLTAAVFLFLTVTGTYFYSRFLLAEYHLRQAQLALTNNNGLEVYNHSIAAVSLVPTMTNYRLSYSQVNLSLASALSQKADLTEADRTQITTLVSQAIREGRLATTLRPSDARTWINLGSVYRNLINVAEGAEQYALSAYIQAISLDRANPALRVEYGGILFQLASAEEDTDTKNRLLSQALTELQTAIQLKGDYANAYYNLSKVYSAAGNTVAAYNAMAQAVASLDPSSPDLEIAKEELAQLQSSLPSPAPSNPPASSDPTPTPSPSELSAPSPLPSPLDGGPLTLEPSPSPSPEQ